MIIITEDLTREMGNVEVEIEEIPIGYKLTELGVLPDDWEDRRLGDIASIATGNTPPTNIQANYGNEFLFVSPADISKEKFIVTTLKKLSKTGYAISRKFPRGSILFTCIGSTIGKCAIASVDLTSNQQINAVFPSSNFSYQYLYYSLCSAGPRIRSLAGEQAVPIVNKFQFSETVLAIPPLTEQENIADVLSDIDSLITSLDQLIAKKRDIQQAAMQQLLTGKQRLPGFSGEWEKKQLGDVAYVNMGQSPDSRNYNSNGQGIPLIQGNADIKNRKSIYRVWTTHNTKTCKKGDLILTVRAPVGSIGVASDDSCLGRGVCSLKPINVNNGFLFHAMVFAEESWKLLEQGSTFTSANSAQIAEFPIMVPNNKDEQKAIANVLSDMNTEITTLEQQLDKTRNLKQGMMQELLTGRIRLI